MAGLVPAIHKHRFLLVERWPRRRDPGATEIMDGRDKPGHDVI